MEHATETTEEWTPLHAAARMACGEALEGESTARMERRVRLAWEAMLNDGVGIETRFEYVRDADPVSTFRVWSEFGESSALRIELESVLEAAGGMVDDMAGLEGMMRSAYRNCISDALGAMPWAVDEASDIG